MFGRTLKVLGIALATQMICGCWCCHRPFLCCGHRYFAPAEPCTTCYQPGAPAPMYSGMPMQPIPYVKSPAPVTTGAPATTNPPATPPMGTIPWFPAASATFTNAPIR